MTLTRRVSVLLNAPGGPCACGTCRPATYTPAGLIVDNARPAAALEATITARDGLDWHDARLAMRTVATEQRAELRTWWIEHRSRTWAALRLVRTGGRP